MNDTKTKYQSVLAYFAADPQMGSQEFFSTLDRFVQVCVALVFHKILIYMADICRNTRCCREIEEGRREKGEPSRFERAT
jgi:hypothetical protein